MVELTAVAIAAIVVLAWIVVTQQKQIRILTSVAISKHSTLDEQSRISTDMTEDRREIKLVPSYIDESREVDLEKELDDDIEEEEPEHG